MSIVASPSATFEAVCTGFASGLTGTIGVRLLDNAGATTAARVTAGIAEYPASSGIYYVTMTAPATAGQYTVMWDTGTVSPSTVATEDLVVNWSAATVGGTSNLYVTVAELKEILRQEGETYQDLALEIAVSAGSRACDSYKRKRGVGFYPTTATRYYTPNPNDRELHVDDIVTVTTLDVDRDGDGVYEETWTEGDEYYLAPLNATADGRPFNTVCLYPQSTTRFPRYPRSIKITGSFGWAETPIEVRQACILIARDLLKRTVDQPLDILVAAAGEAVTTAHLGRMNRAAAWLLDQIDPVPSSGTLQLG